MTDMNKKVETNVTVTKEEIEYVVYQGMLMSYKMYKKIKEEEQNNK